MTTLLPSAMEAGKHVLVEVPGAQTIEDCWRMVETCEKTRRHCMMLENCCYGEMEMLAWNLVHKGLLGTLTHAEGAYIHNLCWRHLENSFRNAGKQKPGRIIHKYGNGYPTHPLGPICMYMDMNRGDRMESIVSISSREAAHSEFAAATYKPDDWQNRISWRTGDMNTSIIKTAVGRTILHRGVQSFHLRPNRIVTAVFQLGFRTLRAAHGEPRSRFRSATWILRRWALTSRRSKRTTSS